MYNLKIKVLSYRTKNNFIFRHLKQVYDLELKPLLNHPTKILRVNKINAPFTSCLWSSF